MLKDDQVCKWKIITKQRVPFEILSYLTSFMLALSANTAPHPISLDHHLPQIPTGHCLLSLPPDLSAGALHGSDPSLQPL